MTHNRRRIAGAGICFSPFEAYGLRAMFAFALVIRLDDRCVKMRALLNLGGDAK
jgi:hypothetical protein